MGKGGAARERMGIVIVGHVDHGKSTVIGRLLADTHSLPKGKLEQVRALCERNSKPFEYAFLLDALKDEQAQGITIDSARVFFKTRARDYLIVDAPGHIEFLKNMVTGAARAEAALLVIDAHEGVQENSRRHGYLLSMLGISQVAVLINKMDLVGYGEAEYDRIVSEYGAFLRELGAKPSCFVPVAAFHGENIVDRAEEKMRWYQGPTVVEVLDRFGLEKPPIDRAFRMPVQDVYKFTKSGDSRRIVAGTVESGSLKVGDEVVFYPSGKRSRVKSIEAFHAPAQAEAPAGRATGFTLTEQVYVLRGEVATRPEQPRPEISARLKISLFWLGKEPLLRKKQYLLKLGAAKVRARVEEIERVIDASSLKVRENADRVNRNDVADCVLKLDKAIAFDLSGTSRAASRFVLVDDYDISGGGIIREALKDEQAWVREKVILRNYKWEMSGVAFERRAEKYNQKATLVLITGPKDSRRKEIARALEARLFADGRVVYYLGIGNVLHGVDADLTAGNREVDRQEHLRRLGEVAHILLDAGTILIVTAQEFRQEDLEIAKATLGSERIETVWVGDRVTTDIAYDLWLRDQGDDEALEQIRGLLQDKGIIFRPW